MLGVQVTVVSGTVAGLIEFGRLDPPAVVVASSAGGDVTASAFIREIKLHSSPLVVVALDSATDPEGANLLIAGAAAAVIRPYSAEALWSVLERSGRIFDDARITRGPIEVDSQAFVVRVHGQRLADFPLKEFEMLRLLLQHAPEVISDEELRTSLWGAAPLTHNTIAVHAARLRHRLDGVAQIRRIRGRGYSLVFDEHHRLPERPYP